MNEVILTPPVRYWACPSCQGRDRTEQFGLHVQGHACPALGGLAVPMVEVSSADARPDGRHVLVEREDYIGHSGANRLAAIRTERGDGSNDCTVFAPVADIAVAGR